MLYFYFATDFISTIFRQVVTILSLRFWSKQEENSELQTDSRHRIQDNKVQRTESEKIE